MNIKHIRGLASIIVPCRSQLEFTRRCVAALKSHTQPPWELIVVDNGSTDGTAVYLEGVRDLAAVTVTVIANAVNRGFPAAINQGLQRAHGEYLVLLNNDVVVTDGWLDQLIGLANMRDRGTAEIVDGVGREESSPPAAVDPVIGCAESTPPCPPLQEGGQGLAWRRC